jgi:hypothetical protein
MKESHRRNIIFIASSATSKIGSEWKFCFFQHFVPFSGLTVPYQVQSRKEALSARVGRPQTNYQKMAHNLVTLELAKQEHAEHMEGMDEAAAQMIQCPLIVKAYALDDPSAPTGDNVKTVHFVRHGQGFHNLMADLARKAGQTWVQVSFV